MNEQYPKTLAEAVNIIIRDMTPQEKQTLRNTSREELIKLHFSAGMQIRNQFGLWNPDSELLKSFGTFVHSDSASMKIIEAVWRKLDRIVPLAASGKRMPDFIKGSRLVVIEGAPHGMNWTHAEEINRALLAFLGENE